jgi:hypothetical protein
MLGMSRSGTSLTTRLLNLIGVYLGPEEELLSGLPSNPDGHWENRAMMRFNEWLLRSLGGRWHTPPEFAPDWERSEALAEERTMARRFLEATFGGRELWGWKDPRNCLTVPFWQNLLPEMRYVICLRNPIDVAASLNRREEMEASRSFELWLAYVEAALANTEGRPRVFVSYEDYFDDWRASVARLARFVGGEPPADGSTAAARIESTIKESLRHHRTPPEAALGEGRVPTEVATLYAQVRGMAGVEPLLEPAKAQ